MTEVKFLLTMVMIIVAGIMGTLMVVASTMLDAVDNQRVQICLDHPTYKSCPQWQR